MYGQCIHLKGSVVIAEVYKRRQSKQLWEIHVFFSDQYLLKSFERFTVLFVRIYTYKTHTHACARLTYVDLYTYTYLCACLLPYVRVCGFICECVWTRRVVCERKGTGRGNRKKEIYTNCENIIAFCTDNLPRNQFPVKTSGFICTRIWKSKAAPFFLSSA